MENMRGADESRQYPKIGPQYGGSADRAGRPCVERPWQRRLGAGRL